MLSRELTNCLQSATHSCDTVSTIENNIIWHIFYSDYLIGFYACFENSSTMCNSDTNCGNEHFPLFPPKVHGMFMTTYVCNVIYCAY